MNKLQIGQDVLYIHPTTKEECAAKVVRIVDRTKQIVNLTLFTDNAQNAEVVRNVSFDETGNAPNTWYSPEQQEQSRAAGSSR
jgi:hypothetical protein